MNIGIDIRSLGQKPYTGISNYTYHLLEALFKIDSKNQYFLFFNSNQTIATPDFNYPNVHQVITHYPNKIFNSLLKFNLIKLDKITSKKSKIRSLDFWFSPNLNFTSLSKSCKQVLTIHDLSFEFYPEFYSFKQNFWHKIISPKKQCRVAKIILVPSESTKLDLINFYKIPAEKITVSPLGIDLATTTDIEKIKEKYNLPNNFVLFLGTIEPRKNIPSLLDAFKNSPYNLVIAGATGWKNKNILEQIKSNPNTQLLLNITEKEKSALYKLANIFIYPSFYEGFGFPILEAFKSGIPVITSNRSSLPEVAGQAAEFVNPYHPQEILAATNKILNNSELKNQLVTAGFKQAENFSSEKCAQTLLNIFSA